MNVTDFSIRRPVFTIVTMALILILGFVSFTRIPVTLIPELKAPIGVVVTNYPGVGPNEVNEKITKPLEAVLSTLPGLQSTRSTSQEGSNFILLEFAWDKNIDDVQLDVLQRLDGVPMPEGADRPRFLKFDPSQFPVVQLALRSGSGKDVRVVAEELEKQLRQTEGVANVSVSGKLVEEVRVLLDEEKLKETGLAQEDVLRVIQASNVSLPGDPVATEDGRQLTTRILSALHGPADIRTLPLTVNPFTGAPVTVQDVADVRLTEQDPGSKTRANGESAVLMSVLQQSGANTAAVSDAFRASLEELLQKPEYKGVSADVLFDQGDYVKLAIGNIGQSLLLGGAFAMLTLFVFLRGWKSPLIIGVAIPYSVVVTFVLMFFADFSLNIMTLGALALGIGMLVDNAIVVIENIERHLGMGKERRQAASDGTREVASAIIASTLTTVAVFVPVVFITGLIGQLFTEFALTISFSLFASLAVALTVVPMLASRSLAIPPPDSEEQRQRSKPYAGFARSVAFALRHRGAVLGAVALLVALSVYGLQRIGTEFLPPTDEGFFTVSVDTENGSSLEATDRIVKKMEKVLSAERDVDVSVALAGSTQQALSRGTSSPNRAELYVKLKPLEERSRSTFQFADDIRPKLIRAGGKGTEVDIRMQTASGSSPDTLQFTLTGVDEGALRRAVDALEPKLRALPGMISVKNDISETVDEVQLNVKRDEAAAYGLPPALFAQSVKDMTRGAFATQILGKNEAVQNVFVQLRPEASETTDALGQLDVRTPSGAFAKVEDLADVRVAKGPVAIHRVDQASSVQFNLKYRTGETLGAMSDEVDAAIESAGLPKEMQVLHGGDRDLFDSAAGDMKLAVLLAAVLVYIVMAAQFESLRSPFIIMFTVPLMIIGIALGLTAPQTPIGVTAIIGILILVGIVVNNGIVLVDYINQRKAAGLPALEAIVTSARDRVRPILMTALTTILGLLPLALGLGEGTEINRPMGIVVIGGLLSSTVFTLYIVPILFSLFDRETRRRAA